MGFYHNTPDWYSAVPSFRRSMIFVDGENLVFRYQDMASYKSNLFSDTTLHKEDVYVWRNDFPLSMLLHEVIRATYYTSVFPGNEKETKNIKGLIKNLTFERHLNSKLPNTFTPHLFKKKRYQQKNKRINEAIELVELTSDTEENDTDSIISYIPKSKGVDIQITVDILNHVHSDNVDTVLLFSGDGDFIPVMTEVQRCGKQFWVYAFSKGLNPEIEPIADKFICIDNLFFGS